MTQAITARRDGDIFQARMFWLRAVPLLIPDSPVSRVGFESGPRSFDDIWVEYEPGLGPHDQFGNVLRRENIQCKWHGRPGTYGYADLVDPAFINADSSSLLERALEAQRTYAPNGTGTKFTLLTNWQPAMGDPLASLINNRFAALRIDELFKGKTARSATGAIRKLWAEHLGVDEEALRRLAQTLGFSTAFGSLEEIRNVLNLWLARAGLRCVRDGESASPYDDLVFEWMAQRRQEFDRAVFRDACRCEGLFEGEVARVHSYGIKSFVHPIDPIEHRCIQVLDLTAAFDRRFIHDEADWENRLYPDLRRFLLDAAQSGDRLRLVIDAHATLAFAAGAVLDIKSGRAIELEQRSGARQVWTADDSKPDPAWPSLETYTIECDPNLASIAVAVAVTHDIAADVQDYVSRALPDVGRILVCRPGGGAGSMAIACGRHAFDLASAIAAKTRDLIRHGDGTKVHLFCAAPNALIFFLGQRQPRLGRLALYEYDFEGSRDRSYLPSLTLPIAVSESR